MVTRRPLSTGLLALAGTLLLATPAAAQEGEDDGNGESARGSVSIEDEELTSAEPPNEVKVGCGFRIDFFGFDEQTVPVRLSLMPPSGEAELTERSVALEEARGNDPSGSLEVSLADELADVEPAQAEDYDYKVRVEVVVKETAGTEVTKSANLFIECPEAVAAFGAGGEPEDVAVQGEMQEAAPEDEEFGVGGAAPDDEEFGVGGAAPGDEEAEDPVVPRGGVDAGAGPATATDPAPGALVGALAALVLAVGLGWGVRRSRPAA